MPEIVMTFRKLREPPKVLYQAAGATVVGCLIMAELGESYGLTRLFLLMALITSVSVGWILLLKRAEPRLLARAKRIADRRGVKLRILGAGDGTMQIYQNGELGKAFELGWAPRRGNRAPASDQSNAS